MFGIGPIELLVVGGLVAAALAGAVIVSVLLYRSSRNR
jgi:hypothetical protein